MILIIINFLARKVFYLATQPPLGIERHASDALSSVSPWVFAGGIAARTGSALLSLARVVEGVNRIAAPGVKPEVTRSVTDKG